MAGVMKIKNWTEFQHFKDRTPPWIKLYKGLLDDPDWHDLKGEHAKVLVMLWLVASEDKDREGKLPCMKKLAFRLRTTEVKLVPIIQALKGWLILDDNTMISGRYQDDAPEKRRDREEKRREEAKTMFEDFWGSYPRRVKKEDAFKAWTKIKPDAALFSEIMDGLNRAKRSEQWTKDNGQYIPHPTTWLNQRRWTDEMPEASQGVTKKLNWGDDV